MSCKMLLFLALLSVCFRFCFSSEDMALSPADPSSYSRPDLAVVKHISLSWVVNFTEKTISGSAELNIDVLHDVSDIILDSSDLSINRVKDAAGNVLQYTVTNHVPDFGSKLTVKLKDEAKSGKKVKLLIEYSTSSKARALQWLEASQTSGKQHPYMFSQCQPIHARTILPCQDTPAAKFTYNATVVAPAQFTVLMSALRNENCTDSEEGRKTRFEQPVPIPAYLLAIAVGSLQSKRLGPRSLVWSETAELERSAWEFTDTEKFLQAAERLCGPYVWTQYDLLVLPPSFPYGGMENPCLTFVTPTLLAGDRSQADVIVHEIMHSWTGNLITNLNFEHFWLNEGFTVFLERKVAASLLPDPIEARKSRDFESILGLQELNESINGHLGVTNPLTSLVVDLDGVHPDDAFSRVPYEKGSLFLRYIEDLVGGPSVFDEFLRSYFDHFKYLSLSTDDFKEYLLNYFDGTKALDAVDWESWLYKPGMPPVVPEYDTTLSKDCVELASRLRTDPISAISPKDIEHFSPHQLIKLLGELLSQEPLPLNKLQAIGEMYQFKSTHNTEILYRWYLLSIKSEDESVVDKVLEFVNSQGRMKYVRPLYRDLYAWESMRQKAIDNFLKNEQYMMHVTAYTLRKDLHLNKAD